MPTDPRAWPHTEGKDTTTTMTAAAAPKGKKTKAVKPEKITRGPGRPKPPQEKRHFEMSQKAKEYGQMWATLREDGRCSLEEWFALKLMCKPGEALELAEMARQEGWDKPEQPAAQQPEKLTRGPGRHLHQAPALAKGTEVEVSYGKQAGMVGTVVDHGIVTAQGYYTGDVTVEDARGQLHTFAPSDLAVMKGYTSEIFQEDQAEPAADAEPEANPPLTSGAAAEEEQIEVQPAFAPETEALAERYRQEAREHLAAATIEPSDETIESLSKPEAWKTEEDWKAWMRLKEQADAATAEHILRLKNEGLPASATSFVYLMLGQIKARELAVPPAIRDLGTAPSGQQLEPPPPEPVRDDPPVDVQIWANMKTADDSARKAREQRKKGENSAFAVRMPEGRMDAVKAAAERNHMSAAAYINAAIETLLGLDPEVESICIASYQQHAGSNSESAEIKRATNRITGAVILAEDTWHIDSKMDSTAGRWGVRCETHGGKKGMQLKSEALSNVATPWNWCAGCKGVLSNLGMPLTVEERPGPPTPLGQLPSYTREQG